MLLRVCGTRTLLCLSLKFSFMLNELHILPWHLQTDFQLTQMMAHEIPCIGWHSDGGHPTVLRWRKCSCFLLPVTVLVGNSVLAVEPLLFGDPPPLQLEKCRAWKKKDTILRRWETQGVWLGSPWWGFARQVWDLTGLYIVSPLCPSVCHLLWWQDLILSQNTKL